MRSLLAVVSLALTVAFANAQNTPSWKGKVTIQSTRGSGKCVTAASDTNGAAVTLQTCNGSEAQKWEFKGGAVRIFANKCLDVRDGANTNGNKLQIWTCYAGSANQQFNYNIWDEHLSWKDKGKCVDLSEGSMADGNPIQIWSCSGNNPNQVWYAGYQYNQLPNQTQNGQYGTNNCGTTSSPSSNCQTAWLNSLEDFCLWGPPNPDSTIGDTERMAVAYCTKSGRGTRTFPAGTLKGVHLVKTPDYVQITGVGDFTKINIRKGDDGGELDPHGADGNGNPIGGLLYGSHFGANLQYHEWTSFISDDEFCIRACVGPKAAVNCNHIYDVMGCWWNIPGSYSSNVFETCLGDSTPPMGVYGTSTWYQGVKPTPPPHSPAATSSCKTIPTISVTPLKRKREPERLDENY